MRRLSSIFGFLFLFGIFHLSSAPVQAVSISNFSAQNASVRVYEKYEARFAVDSSAQYPFFQYDTNTPAGVTPKTGITVEAIITTPSGKVIRQPAFYMTETVKNGSVYVETNKKYWAIRYSPQEVGIHKISLSAQDVSGTTTIDAGTFQAITPVRDGFIQVSKNDSRYFEFTDGKLYFPTGPANFTNNSYSIYKDSGANIERPWVGGTGIYSTNWARWKSSAENHGNEGIKTRFSWREKYPGHDLSYEIFYNTDPSKGPNGFKMWLTSWMDDDFAGRIQTGHKYQLKLVFKAVSVTGPRNSSTPNYGFVVKAADNQWGADNWSVDQWDAKLHTFPSIAPVSGSNFTSSSDSRCATVNNGWCTYMTTFTAPKDQDSFYLYLDNVTGGQVYIDEFSMKEVDGSGTIIGGEIVRNAQADEHTYVEQRPAAELDDRITNAEQNGVFLKLVVHDKNDWIQGHLKSDGTWADAGDGYYQAENTKARWLLRQWYRYFVARWGYSTAVHSLELNNEGPPNDDPPGSNTAPHWRTAQAFANYIHQIYPARRILTTTSFWCCWRPKFWGNTANFPDIDYADLHMYLSNIENGLVSTSDQYDLAMWTYNASIGTYKDGYPTVQKGVGKPTMLGETGIDSGDTFAMLSEQNPGIWYHNMIWAQLNYGALSNPLYWHNEHLLKMTATVPQQTKPFYLFVKDLDLNKGGYSDIVATTSNSKLRLIGQKNTAKNEAHLWIQNTDHTWKKYRDGVRSNQSGTISFTLSPNKTYTATWWDTYAGTVKSTQSVSSDGSGIVTLSVQNLADDTAVKLSIPGAVQPTDSPAPQTSPDEACNADIDQVGTTVAPGYYTGTVNLSDYTILVRDFLKTTLSNPRSNINKDSQNQVNLSDYTILVRWFLKPVTCAR